MIDIATHILIIAGCLIFIGLAILAVLIVSIFVVWMIQVLIEVINNKEI